ncbi:MAG: hypothetical protein CMI13_12045 [Oleibacter sp.]|nr:hypothetical protein [Thalassolituus sp.]|tara:strand:+ start:418 stop:660 length:243 start_codon:yes stop_codon:yes gene_type:complete
MPFVFAALAGFIIGGGVVGYILSQRWKAQVQEAEQALNEIAEQHRKEQQESSALKQELAGIKFELNQTRNELRAARKADD